MGMMDIRRGLLGGVEPPPVTVTGDIAHFNATKKTKALSTQVTFTPYQDLHGYDYPWPGGGGKNKCHFWQYGYFYENGTINSSGNKNGITTPVFVENGQTIIFSTNAICRGRGIAVFTDSEMTPANMIYRSITWTNSSAERPYLSYTATQDCYVSFWLNKDDATDMANGFEQCEAMVEINSEPTSYAPYENICPIQGFVESEIEDSGKNLFDPNRTEGTLVPSTGTPTDRTFVLSEYYLGMNQTNYYYPAIISSATFSNSTLSFQTTNTGYGVAFPVKLLGGQRYSLSYTGENVGVVCFAFFDKDGVYLSNSSGGQNGYPVPSGADTTVVIFFASVANTQTTVSNIQLEFGTTATSYVPYRAPNTIDITFPAVGANKWPTPNITSPVFNYKIPQETYPEIYEAMKNLEVGSQYRCSATSSGNSYINAINIFYNDDTYAGIMATTMLGSVKNLPIRAIYIQSGDHAVSGERNITNIMIGKGSTSSPTYEPFINLIYGATIDPATGNGAIDWETFVIDGVNTVANIVSDSYITDTVTRAYAIFPDVNLPQSSTIGKISKCNCAMYNTSTINNTQTYYPVNSGSRLEVNVRLFNSLTGITTSDSVTEARTKWNAYAALNPISISVKIATPIPIHIDPSKLRLPAGTNYVSGIVKNGSLVKNVDSVSVTARYIEPIITE